MKGTITRMSSTAASRSVDMASDEARWPTIELIVWRHASTEENQAGIMPGQLDVLLSAQGHEEAAEVSVKVASWHPGAIISSDLLRARATAQYLADLTEIDVRLDARLRETSLGTWEGLTRSQAKLAHPGEYAAWRTGEDVIRGGGETAAEVAARVRAAVEEELARSGRRANGPIVVVTHASAGRALVGDLLGLPPSAWTRLAPLSNCAWSALGRDHLGWQLLGHNIRASREVIEQA